MRPLLTQWRRSCATLAAPRRTDSVVFQNALYDEASRFTHTSAAIVAASRIVALPVSVRRNSRSGVSRLRVHAVPLRRRRGLRLSHATLAVRVIDV